MSIEANLAGAKEKQAVLRFDQARALERGTSLTKAANSRTHGGHGASFRLKSAG